MIAATRMVRRAWDVRDYVMASVRREFVARYLGTQLGLFWALAQPLATIAIYTLLFAEIMGTRLPGHASAFAYGINLCAGIVVWQLFSEIVNRLTSMFVHNANLLKKSGVPKVALPTVITLSALVNFGVILALFLLFLALTGRLPGAALAALVPVIVIVAALGVGLGVLLGVINVFYRDVEHALALALNFWFWLTPIVYPVMALPAAVADALAWNPLWPLVRFAQALFVDGIVPAWSSLAYPAIVAVVLLAIGLHAYRALGADLVDEL